MNAGCELSPIRNIRLARTRGWLQRLFLLAAVAPSLAGCDWAVLNPKGPVGAANATILIDSVAIMLAIVIPTIVATLACAWWFRASNARAQYLPDFVYSGRVEMVVWSIPLLTIILLGGVIWIGSHELDTYRPIASASKPTEVQVVSLDWKWLFIYPEQGVASVNELVVPAGTPVRFALTSASVMNAFFVPQLGSMIYTMNGMVTQLNLQADREGDFFGQSAMYSGDGFSGMNFRVRAVSQDGFAAWVSRARQEGPALDKPGYESLSQQSENVQPFTYRSIDPGLFQAVVTQQVPPGPGPATGRGGPRVHPRPEG